MQMLITEMSKASFYIIAKLLYSSSRNDIPRVVERYETMAAQTRRCAAVLVVFVCICTVLPV